MHEAYVDAFIVYMTNTRQVSAHTAEAYAHDAVQFMDFLSFIWGEDRAGDFEAVDYHTMRDYIAQLHQQKYEKRSIARKLTSLRSFFRFLVAEELVTSNPASLARLPKLDSVLPEFLYPQEMVALLSAPDTATDLGMRDRAILELFYATGVRRSELVNMRLPDFDMTNFTIRVTGKGNKQREVLFGELASVALEQYVDVARPRLLAHRVGGGDEQTVFLSKNGRPLDASYTYTLVQKYVMKAGVSSNISPHALRHSFATHMLDGGADLRTIQELLGHTSLRSTEIYTHVTTRRMKEVYGQTHPLARGGFIDDEER